MTAAFEGQPGITQISQPEDSEWCFAAIVTSVANQQPLEQVHQALVGADISVSNGHTPCPQENGEVQLAGDATLKVEPFIGLNTETFLAAINERLKERKTVALLHKKNDDELDDRHHWTLVAGRYHIDGETQLMVLMDPLQQQVVYADPSQVTDMIERTIDFNGGVRACALSVDQAPTDVVL